MRAHLLLCCLPLAAMAADFPDLPPAPAVEKALRAHPAVRAAQAGVAVGQARRDEIAAGPHEFNVRLEGQRRREVPVDTNYWEHAVGIERPLRLPGKAAKDEALGEATLEQSHNAYGDALHEASRLLLKAWFDWQREGAAAREWQAQVDVLIRQQQAVARRVATGDAARLESMLSEAQLNQAQAQLAQAEMRAQLAAGELKRHFPTLPLPAQVPDVEPRQLPAPPAQWQDKMVERSHELALARSVSRRQMLAAQRADAERIPDPTVGVRVGQERGGQDHLVGLHLSIPLPGAARSAAANAARAEGGVAAAREAETLAKVEGEARRTLAQAEANHSQWQRFAAVAARMEENARLLDRAWRLGEGQFADLQQARRQAIEARLAAAQARLDAAEAYYRVQVDAHELWALDEDH
ncbi:MAG: outer rane efflux protein [Rhodocyclaceae bacterium]|nr:outer rane efflux protein [Rhodocyclaceae bacterium]